MKVLILLKEWSGGIEVVAKNISEGLKKKGHQVDVISRREDLKINSLVKSIYPIRKRVKELMDSYEYDIIFCIDWSMAFPLMFPYPIYKEKVFCEYEGLNSGLSGFLQKAVAQSLGKRLISTGDPVKEAFPKSKKIFSGVDKEKFKRIEKIKRIKNSVGFVNKQIDLYNYNKIKSAVERQGKKFFAIWGEPKEKMPEFYNKIETFISLPPSCTGFNLCWLEAMACGVPKIIGNLNGIGCRLVIDKIETFQDLDDALLNAESKDYRSLILEEFSWENHVNELLEMWNEK